MRNLILIIFIFLGKLSFSQKKEISKKAKNTIKTEIIDVITPYTPKITDAFKINKNPTIQFSKKNKKKKLNYTIFSVPVASTFTPKSGTLKELSLKKRERLYNNYLALGFGNNRTPFLETLINTNTRFKNHFGLYAKYISSSDGVKNTALNSSFANLITNLYYKEQERYFNWKVGLHFEQNQYNWYGLPNNIPFNQNIIDAIDEQQNYNFFELTSKITPSNSFVNFAKVTTSYFFDRLKNKEYSASLQSKFQFSLKSLGQNFNDLFFDVSLDYLSGNFLKSYKNNSPIKHSFITLGTKPTYNFNYKKLNVKLGANIYVTWDTQNNINQFFSYPNITISHPIIVDFANLYVGTKGNLHTNSYKNFVSQNPYVSPTISVIQTNEVYNFFAGLNGKLSPNISYNTKISYQNEQNKPLFSINNSKSDGLTNNPNLLSYEYGNSFRVIYDNIRTLTFFGEIEVDFFKNFTVGANGELNHFSLQRQIEAWNLPTLKGELFAKYKTDKWYANTHIFLVGNRKDTLYNNTFPSTFTSQEVKSYFDVNFNTGYNFTNKFSTFLQLKNIFNNNYKQFQNFTVQGFQILGGITWKFDF